MKKDIIIVGARGLGLELAGYIEDDPRYRILCFLDEVEVEELCGRKVINPSDYNGSCRDAIFAVGYPQHKQTILEKYGHLELNWQNYIHPTSVVSKQATVGLGSILAPYSIVAGNAKIENFVILNAYASTAHHSVVGDFSSLMPYASVLGNSQIGDGTLIAVGSKVLPDVKIGERCRVSAGAIVMHDMPSYSLISGNPAKGQPDIFMLRSRHRKNMEKE